MRDTDTFDKTQSYFIHPSGRDRESFIFINFDQQAEPFGPRSTLIPLPYVRPYNPSEMRTVKTTVHEANRNGKIGVENDMEASPVFDPTWSSSPCFSLEISATPLPDFEQYYTRGRGAGFIHRVCGRASRSSIEGSLVRCDPNVIVTSTACIHPLVQSIMDKVLDTSLKRTQKKGRRYGYKGH